MDFEPFAIETRSGPHVTMQAGVVQGDRYWTTTSRSSLKAKAIRKREQAAFVHASGSGLEVVAGTSRVLDPVRPLDTLTDLGGALHSGLAVARLGLSQLDQLRGYLEVGTDVPLDWLPTGRVALVTRMEHRVVVEDHAVTDAAGAWDRKPRSLQRWTDAPSPVALAVGDLPDDIHLLLAEPAERAWLGLLTDEGPVTLPAAWSPGQGVAVSGAALQLLDPRLPGPVSVTIDQSSSRRPDEKQGAMLRGTAGLIDVQGEVAHLALAVERITYWSGFDSRTVPAA